MSCRFESYWVYKLKPPSGKTRKSKFIRKVFAENNQRTLFDLTLGLDCLFGRLVKLEVRLVYLFGVVVAVFLTIEFDIDTVSS